MGTNTREYSQKYYREHKAEMDNYHKIYMKYYRHGGKKASFQFPVSELQIIREDTVSLNVE